MDRLVGQPINVIISVRFNLFLRRPAKISGALFCCLLIVDMWYSRASYTQINRHESMKTNSIMKGPK